MTMNIKNRKYYPLLYLLKGKYGWELHQGLRNSRDCACMTVRVHGCSMTNSMYLDIINQIETNTQKACNAVNDSETLNRYKVLLEQIKILSKID